MRGPSRFIVPFLLAVLSLAPTGSAGASPRPAPGKEGVGVRKEDASAHKDDAAAKTPARSAPATREGEVRAAWVTRWDFRSEADVRKVIAGCAALGFNQVVFQVRGQADAYYRSALEPWGEELDGPPERGGDPGFDPLQTAIDEAHARGIELHAWANVLPGWKGTVPPRSRKHLVHLHPDWFLANRAGKRKIYDRDHYSMLNPCLPAARAHLVAVMDDIASRYAIDGMQIDYIRFLERDGGRGEDAPFDATTLALFRKEAGGLPDDKPEAWDAFRRRAIDKLVEDISGAVRARRPACRISAAVMRDASQARAKLFQDGAGWRRRGWIDDLYPMNYEPDIARFSSWTREWSRSSGGQSVVVGIGVHLLPDAQALRDQIRQLRGAPAEERAAGYCLFACSELFLTAADLPRDQETAARRAAFRAALTALNRPAEITRKPTK